MINKLSLFHKPNKSTVLINAIRKKCSKRKDVLEIGCGEGHVLNLLSRDCRKVVALDRSKDMLTSAVKKAGHKKNITFKRQDFFGYRPRDKFGLIVAVNSLNEGDQSDMISAVQKVHALLTQTGAPLVRSAGLFDVYRGEQIGVGKKSLAYRLVYQADDRTLTDKEVAKLRGKIVRRLEREIDASLRG